MPTVSCICNECGKHFFVKDSYIPVSKNSMRIEKNSKSPKTWEEWIFHTMSFCEECQIKEIPKNCLEDYQKIISS